MASTVYAMYLQSLIQQQAAARDAQQMQAQQDAAGFDQLQKTQQFAFQQEEADFNRKFKIAELYGKTAAMTGEAPPKMRNAAYDEMAQLSSKATAGERQWKEEDLQTKLDANSWREELARDKNLRDIEKHPLVQQLLKERAGEAGRANRVGGEIEADVIQLKGPLAVKEKKLDIALKHKRLMEDVAGGGRSDAQARADARNLLNELDQAQDSRLRAVEAKRDDAQRAYDNSVSSFQKPAIVKRYKQALDALQSQSDSIAADYNNYQQKKAALLSQYRGDYMAIVDALTADDQAPGAAPGGGPAKALPNPGF